MKVIKILEDIREGWLIATSREVEFLNTLIYVFAPVLAILFSIIIFLETNKELWK